MKSENKLTLPLKLINVYCNQGGGRNENKTEASIKYATKIQTGKY